MERVFKPAVIETKEQLLMALKNGKIKSSKYNLLDDEDKLFVELVCFGDMNGEQAMKVINPKLAQPRTAANRKLANPDVSAVLEEFTVQKNKKFAAEIAAVRDMALAKARYIMNNSSEEAVQLAAAKLILDKAEKAIMTGNDDDSRVDGIRFHIEVANMYTQPVETFDAEATVIIDVEAPPEPEVNAETGNPYTLFYEGVDSYTRK